MAIKYLSNISLEGNELQNVKIHPAGVAPSNGAGKLYYNTSTNKLMANTGSAWYSVNGDIESLTSGNTDTLVIGGTAADPTLTVQTSAVAENSNALATGDQIYDAIQAAVNGLSADTNHTYDISVTDGTNDASIDLNAGGSGSGTDSVVIAGTSNEIEIEGSTASKITIGLPSDVTIGNDLTVTGDLIVNGTTTSVNSNTVNIGDNMIVLNADETGTPSQDGGIEVERGTSNNAKMFFSETLDRWVMNDGVGDINILKTGEYNPTIGTDTDIDLDSAQVIETVSLTDGVVTGFTSRNLTLSDIGFTGDSNANNVTNNNQLTNGANYISDYTVTQGDVTAHQAALSITESQISDLSHVTNNNQLVNGANYITSASIPTATSDLTNDSGFITDGNTGWNNSYGFITDYTVSSADVTAHEGDITITESQISDLSHFSGDYNDLTNQPTIPTINNASTTVAGIVELATTTETNGGSLTNRAVTPAGLHASLQDRNQAHHVVVTIGDASSTTLTATHNFGDSMCDVQIVEVSTGETVYAEVTRATNSVDVSFGVAPATNAYKVLMTQMVY